MASPSKKWKRGCFLRFSLDIRFYSSFGPLEAPRDLAILPEVVNPIDFVPLFQEDWNGIAHYKAMTSTHLKALWTSELLPVTRIFFDFRPLGERERSIAKEASTAMLKSVCQRIVQSRFAKSLFLPFFFFRAECCAAATLIPWSPSPAWLSLAQPP